ncbi:MAG: hypothetical protein WBD71_06660 [Xanthobacteraceae bacterium]
MQKGIVMALALTALSATVARADQWCGYATQKNAVVQCGYMTSADCESAVGKGGMCFVDPDLVRNFTPTKPERLAKPPRTS